MTSGELVNTLSDDYDQLYRRAYRICGNRFDAEDALQTACLKAWEHHPTTDLHSSCLAWMTAIVHHESISLLRKRRRTVCGLPEDWAAGVAAPEADMACRELFLLAETLTPADQEVFRLRYREGVPVQEIARRLGKPRPTVSTALRRVRSTLARALREE